MADRDSSCNSGTCPLHRELWSKHLRLQRSRGEAEVVGGVDGSPEASRICSVQLLTLMEGIQGVRFEITVLASLKGHGFIAYIGVERKFEVSQGE